MSHQTFFNCDSCKVRITGIVFRISVIYHKKNHWEDEEIDAEVCDRCYQKFHEIFEEMNCKFKASE